MIKKKRRRRKKFRYHRGLHKSKKSKSVLKYRSGWELTTMLYFDFSDDVLEYSYEELRIPYQASKIKIRTYIPDFLVTYKNGDKLLIEVKRADKLNQAKVQKKIKAAQDWCSKNNIVYEIWSDDKIKELEKLIRDTVNT